MPHSAHLISTLDAPDVEKFLAASIDKANQCLIASAYGSHLAFTQLFRAFEGLLRRNGELKILLDTQSLMTSPELIEEIATIPGDSKCRLYIGGSVAEQARQRSFHVKMYCMRADSDCEFLVGSSNFTKGGLANNIEAATIVRCKSEEEFAVSAYGFWDRLWNHPQCSYPTDRFLERYKDFYKRYRDRIVEIDKEIPSELHRVLAEEAIGLGPNEPTRLAYLLGLVCGGAALPGPDYQSRLLIHFESGERSYGGTRGVIAAPDVTGFSIDQAKAMEGDARRILETIQDGLVPFGAGSADVNRVGTYAYVFDVHLATGSPLDLAVKELLQSGEIVGGRYYPKALPSVLIESKDGEVDLAFLRGYFDVRGRVSAADRAGTTGALRIQLSISQHANEFGHQVADLMRARFGAEHLNYLEGEDRERESMIRIEAQDVPSKLFTSAWQQIMHHDFVEFNIRHFGRVLPKLDDEGRFAL